ncbi:MAG: hypothetical protein U0183_08630 [Polyangiaceae bacterium]
MVVKRALLGMILSVSVGVCSLVGCGGRTPTAAVAEPPRFEPKDQAKCGVAKSHAKPLIVEWPSSERSELEARAKRGVVAVRYVGCEMEMLPRCHVPGTYKYVAITPKSDGIVIRDADELYTNVPLGAAKLEARLSRAASLRVAMTIVGRYEADADEVRTDQLRGDCARATHFVSALTAGAFDFYAEGKARVAGSAAVLGAGGGGDTAAERENITKDGDATACSGAKSEDPRPPSSCGALLRMEVTPFGAARRVEAQCPEGSKWSGSACVRTNVVTEVQCPGGTKREGARCVPLVSTACPAGLVFREGRGCVPETGPTASTPSTPSAMPSSPGAASAAPPPEGPAPTLAETLDWLKKGFREQVASEYSESWCGGGGPCWCNRYKHSYSLSFSACTVTLEDVRRGWGNSADPDKPQGTKDATVVAPLDSLVGVDVQPPVTYRSSSAWSSTNDCTGTKLWDVHVRFGAGQQSSRSDNDRSRATPTSPNYVSFKVDSQATAERYRRAFTHAAALCRASRPAEAF